MVVKQCVACAGLVPEKSSSCPNCDATARLSGVRRIKAAAFTALLITSCGAVPVYGAPCTARELDGGNRGCIDECEEPLADGGSPKKDATTACFQPDGGAP